LNPPNWSFAAIFHVRRGNDWLLAETRVNYTSSILVSLAAALGVNVQRLDVLDINSVAAPAGARRLLTTLGVVDISVILAPDSTSSSQDSQGLLQSSLASLSNLTVLSVQQGACGICGNEVCEAGERCDAGGTGCCVQDCPLTLSSCPSAAGSTVPCSGSGVCLPSSGVCSCFSGYLGAACDFPYFAQAILSPIISSTQPCALRLGWEQLVSLKVSGHKIHSGGLGEQMTVDFRVWMCIDPALAECVAPPASAAVELACFCYNERLLRFEWIGWNSALSLV
jgi:hypothetical protein